MNPSEAQAYALVEALRLGGTDDPIGKLERFLADEGLADELARHRRAWHNADARTPHGTPIELSREDFPAAPAAAPSPPSP